MNETTSATSEDPIPAAPRATPAEAIAVLVIAALGAGLGAPAEGSATGSDAVDVAMRSALAFAFVLAASHAGTRARVLASLALVVPATFTSGTGTAAAAYAALGFAIFAGFSRSRSRVVGAGTGLLLGQAALRLEWPRTLGLSALFAAGALIVLAASALSRTEGRSRRLVVTSASVLVGLALLVSAGYAALVVSARRDIDHGIALVRLGITQTRDGDTEGGTETFRQASVAFSRADDAINGPWARPARAVPITGKYAKAIGLLAEGGSTFADTGATLVNSSYTKVTLRRGRVDLNQLRGLRSPLRSASATLDRFSAQLDDIDTTWLAAPLTDRIQRLDTRLASAGKDVSTAILAARVLPAMLGGDGERHYFLAFQNPSEQRANGGIIGNFAEITFNDGRFDKARSGRIRELNEAGARTLSAPAEYVRRYTERWKPQTNWQNITVSPDLPTVAQIIEGQYPQSGGDHVDGVVSVDAIGLAALLELTGPVRVSDLSEPLTSKNAARILLRDQYTRFPDVSSRIDFLGEAVDAVIERLKQGDLPAPAKIAKVLAPAVRQGRIKIHSIREPEQSFVERIGVSGKFPTSTRGDFLGVVTQNESQNKIDIFQRRAIDYDASVDLATGDVKTTATVTLYNDSPSSGLPDYVIGGPPDRLLDTGDARTYLSVYTPLKLQRATVDGKDLLMETDTELGWHVYSATTRIPSHGQVVVRLDLEGPVRILRESDRVGYRLDLWKQATSGPDTVNVRIRAGGRAALTSEETVSAPTSFVAWARH